MANILLHTISIVLMFWLMAFVASLLLSSSIFFQRLPRRHRWRPPTPEQLATAYEEPPSPVEKPRISIALRLLWLLFLPFMLSLLILVLIPAFFAMWLCAVGQNYRYLRRTVYRALRRERTFFPAIRSYPASLVHFSRKIAASC